MRSFLSISLLLLLLISCRQEAPKENLSREANTVYVIKPEQIVFSDPLRASGILSTRNEMKLSFKTGGIVESIPVKEGEIVEKGKVLASLDLSEINAQAGQASIALEKAKRDLDRASNLYKDSVATLEMLQNARSAYDIAKAGKKIADFNVKYSRILAPSKGRIQKIIVEKNEMVGPGYPVILFESLENDWIVKVSVADKDIVRFSPGDSASMEFDAFPDKIFSAEVSEVGTFADPLTGTYEIELLIKQREKEFRSGFIARVSIFPSETISGYWVPVEYVYELNGKNGYVYLLDSSEVHQQKVITGALRNDGILILEGLTQDDQLLTEGVKYIKEGLPYNIIYKENAGK